jgi:signal peptidase I
MGENQTTPPKEIQKPKPGFFSIENIRSLGVLVIIVFAIRWSVASPYHVPTASMEPTIKVGDRLLANKLAYGLKVPFTDIELMNWGKPKAGDIIVFKYPVQPDTDYVKRVVGIAGDKIQIKDDVLYINDKPQERTEHDHDRKILDDIEDHKEVKTLFKENLQGMDHWVMQNIPSARLFNRTNWPTRGDEPFEVPADSLFVMGDNRDNSTDSRTWGVVPMNYVRGKATFVIWSVFTPASSDWPVFRFNRFGKWLE